MSQTPSNGGPDWALIGTALATLATVIGTAVAGMKGAFNHSARQTNEQDERRATRDKEATANATLTLDSVFRLVEQLQEEVKRKGEALVDAEKRYAEGMQALEMKITNLERKVAGLEQALRRARGS